MSGLLAWLAQSPLGQLRIPDAVDILVVSILFWAVLGFVRRTGAGFVAAGLGLVGMLYVLARAFALELTATILGAFFAVFLVIVVVIFQEELRQLFERIATVSLRRTPRRTSLGASHVDLLVRCLMDFARDRIGAIVVLPGRQPLGRHVKGGVECGGRVSLPLLKSVFDPHSPGHDGAVILDRGRVTRFAVHLPLARNVAQLGDRGTRHSAALGLSEMTDALCLVVSEERGQISVAKAGRLDRIDAPQPLAARIRGHLEASRPTPAPGPLWWSSLVGWRAMLGRDWGQRLLVLGLVLALWIVVVPGGRPVERTVTVPVEVAEIPIGKRIESVDPAVVTVTFRGLRRAFYFFDPTRPFVRVDGSLIPLGRRTFSVGPEDVQLVPGDLRAQTVEPARVRLSLVDADSEE